MQSILCILNSEITNENKQLINNSFNFSVLIDKMTKAMHKYSELNDAHSLIVAIGIGVLCTCCKHLCWLQALMLIATNRTNLLRVPTWYESQSNEKKIHLNYLFWMLEKLCCFSQENMLDFTACQSGNEITNHLAQHVNWFFDCMILAKYLRQFFQVSIFRWEDWIVPSKKNIK